MCAFDEWAIRTDEHLGIVREGVLGDAFRGHCQVTDAILTGCLRTELDRPSPRVGAQC